ncbi:MAG: putative zinc-binding protein [Marinobacter sp.]|nr:putative zinc-binding protein [Marinobacter sp.]
MNARKDRPLIYACSGCSDVAQLANNAAVRLDHNGEFEMSCISGVGGQVPALVRTARSGRHITVIDGCPLHCARACLANLDIEPDEHVRLYEFGFRKHYGRSYDEDTVASVCQLIRERQLEGDQPPQDHPSPKDNTRTAP